MTLGEQELHQAAPGCQIDGVELVDHGRNDKQWSPVHGLCGRLVLDELEHLGSLHDRTRVIARFLPTSNASSSIIAGVRGARFMSWQMPWLRGRGSCLSSSSRPQRHPG